MLRHTFVPDYSVRAVTDVLYLAMKRTLYLAAKRATLMERSQKIEELGSSEPIDDEVEKVIVDLFFGFTTRTKPFIKRKPATDFLF